MLSNKELDSYIKEKMDELNEAMDINSTFVPAMYATLYAVFYKGLKAGRDEAKAAQDDQMEQYIDDMADYYYERESNK